MKNILNIKDFLLSEGLIREFVENRIIELKNYLTMSYEDRLEILPEEIHYYSYIFEEFLEANPEIDITLEDFEDDYDSNTTIENLKYNYEDVYEEYSKYLYDNIVNKQLDIDFEEYPAWYFMKYENVVKNQWLIHFTNNPFGVRNKGFRFGVNDVSKLGLTKHLKSDDYFVNGGYNFAYLLDEYMKYGYKHKNVFNNRDTFKYGESAVLFKASGIRVYHKTDKEHQVIFTGETAKNFVVVDEGREGSWAIKNYKTNKIIHQSHELKDLVSWIEKNYEQYKDVL